MSKGPNHRKVVYFIATSDYRHVKIGVASNLKQRFTTIQTSHHEELNLVEAFYGDEEVERSLHHKFRQYRVRNEWFRLEGALDEYLDEIADQRRAYELWRPCVRCGCPAQEHETLLKKDVSFLFNISTGECDMCKQCEGGSYVDEFDPIAIDYEALLIKLDFRQPRGRGPRPFTMAEINRALVDVR